MRLKPSLLASLVRHRGGADIVGERIVVEARDRSGNVRTVSRPASIKG